MAIGESQLSGFLRKSCCEKQRQLSQGQEFNLRVCAKSPINHRQRAVLRASRRWRILFPDWLGSWPAVANLIGEGLAQFRQDKDVPEEAGRTLAGSKQRCEQQKGCCAAAAAAKRLHQKPLLLRPQNKPSDNNKARKEKVVH